MDIFQIVTLAIVQGLTEFLPISSSAHLILVPTFTGWSDQGLAFDVAVHVGTLFAVIYYFRTDLRKIFGDWFSSLANGGKRVGDSHLAWAVGFATIPAGLVGLFLGDLIELYLRSPLVIAATTIAFGLLLWYADTKVGQRDEHTIGVKEVIFIGFAQALALIPGTSRSGITMTAAMLLGLSRSAAARFSFLLSIPIIFLAGGLKTLELVEQTVPVDWTALILGTVLSFISAYACIYLFLKMIERMSMLPFVIYRLILGVVLLVVFV